ncbi:MAG TPA: type II toxin-antitoxin system RelE/ParE family toxin, partial [Luteimonas sp.]|nr:type II toxin-antitoxin system RelE/ParE family toxin [Luteimonas sp.]
SLQYRLAVRFYRNASGREPVHEWLGALSKADRKSIGEDIKTVQLGWPLGMPLVRKLEPNLWEVRMDVKHGIARVLFTTVDQAMVLLHGVIKKSQKLPQPDLDLARSRMKETRHGYQ